MYSNNSFTRLFNITTEFAKPEVCCVKSELWPAAAAVAVFATWLMAIRSASRVSMAYGTSFQSTLSVPASRCAVASYTLTGSSSDWHEPSPFIFSTSTSKKNGFSLALASCIFLCSTLSESCGQLPVEYQPRNSYLGNTSLYCESRCWKNSKSMEAPASASSRINSKELCTSMRRPSCAPKSAPTTRSVRPAVLKRTTWSEMLISTRGCKCTSSAVASTMAPGEAPRGHGRRRAALRRGGRPCD
mmetsp:Transcript_53763/g.156257  ORF Transcript_53763/g.156257 Transcript_53763/m.156257 type:complete len:244 (-) Transcript_53763:6-737(-)